MALMLVSKCSAAPDQSPWAALEPASKTSVIGPDMSDIICFMPAKSSASICTSAMR